MRLSKGSAELAKAKVPAAALRDGVLTARRYTSSDALGAGLIDGECEGAELVARAVEWAAAKLPDALGLARFDAASFSSVKTELYTDAYRALTLSSTRAPPSSRL